MKSVACHYPTRSNDPAKDIGGGEKVAGMEIRSLLAKSPGPLVSNISYGELAQCAEVKRGRSDITPGHEELVIEHRLILISR